MKGDRKYLYILIAILAIYVVYELQKPKEVDWSPTLHYRDKIPFGTYVMHNLVADMFQDNKAAHEFNTLYASLHDKGVEGNHLVLASEIQLTDLDFEALLNHVDQGNTVLLVASAFSGTLADSLDLEMGYREEFLTTSVTQIQNALAGELRETITLNLPETTRKFEFPSIAVSGYFNHYSDSLWHSMAQNEDGKSMLLSYKGNSNGHLLVSTMPLAFTNYFVLNEETSAFSSELLSFFPESEKLTHNEYYQLGRLEASSQIRYLLSQEALRWGIGLLILMMLVFMVFEAKRRQRIIPIIKPLQNTTLEFVSVLGRLYYRQQNHSNLAKKRILYWKDFVRRHYNLRTDRLDQEFVAELTLKSGKRQQSIKAIVDLASQVESGEALGEGELMVLEKLLNEFYDIN